ncbi:MAG TPA: MMPL family transporter [Candidatus Binataceae bacterium]|jgi:predicted RND superfamily exporter protein|nr:MMPL family transporter [Candidatus Binataceae bacterium]
MGSLGSGNWGIGDFVLRYRRSIGLLLLAITAFMAWNAAHVRAATKFENLFPADHPNVQLYEKYQMRYGGAQTLVMMIRVRHGDVFNFKTLQKILDLQNAVNTLQAVDHNEVFSLASYRVAYTEAVPGGLVSQCFMYPRLPANQHELDELRHLVHAHRDRVMGLVTPDDKGALVTAAFNADRIDYGALFNQIQGLVHRFSDPNTDIYIAGVPVIVGWGYYYFDVIAVIFLASIALMLAILYLSLGQRSSWWAPILTGSFSALWGLGYVGLMGYNFDPIMMVIPFILTARDLSHGIQWQGRYYDELDALDDKYAACAATTNVMLPPGFLSIIADIAGIIFISLGGIPVLKEIGFAGAVWLAGSLTMVFVFQPIFMSYLPRPRIKPRSWAERALGAGGSRMGSFIDWLVQVPVTPGALRTTILVAGAAFIVWGVASGQRAKIGYTSSGTPLYRPDSKVNRDMAEIGRYVPLDEGWIVLETPDWPSPQSSLGSPVLRMEDDLAAYLQAHGQVAAVVSFSNTVVKGMNRLLHNGQPKYYAQPRISALNGNIWWMFFAGTAPGEMERFFAHNPHVTSTCIRVLLPDHTYDRLNTLRSEIQDFVNLRVRTDPQLKGVAVRYLGGEAGLYAAANDVLYRLDLINITFVLAAIYVFCVISFRSVVAGALFIVSCVMANFGAFVYMGARGIGLTIDTIPVISLGIGLGVDYGIYTVARIRDEVIGGRRLEEAITTALRTTGSAVFSTFAVMIGGILPWAFSPLLFHNEMSVLLIFLMATNMIAGVLILPCFIAWRRPRFICKYERPAGAEVQRAAAGASS